MIFRCTLSSLQTFIVSSPTWFDARSYCRSISKHDAVVEPYHGDPDIELEWRGSDYVKTGERLLWIRERGGEWRRL